LQVVAGCSAIVLVALAGCGGGGHAVRLDGQPASLPVTTDLHELLARMRLLKVDSERYVESSSVTVRASGVPSEHFRSSRLGEVSLAAPPRAETFADVDGRQPEAIYEGRHTYRYSAALGRCDGRRPWSEEGSNRVSLPLAAIPGERDRGGAGPYAGLINLLATARGPIASAGVASVRGQRAAVFTALVDPARQLAGLAEGDIPPLLMTNADVMILQLRLRSAPTRLRIFIAGSGLPLRVESEASLRRGYLDRERLDVLAVNAPTSIEVPTANERISARDAAEYVFGSLRGGPLRSCPGLRRPAIGG
jgi:hypothetical protein